MVAKLVTSGRDRESAADVMSLALDRFEIDGKNTSLAGESQTVTDTVGRLFRFEHRSGSQVRRAWMDEGNLVTELVGSDGGVMRQSTPSQAPLMVDLIENFGELGGLEIEDGVDGAGAAAGQRANVPRARLDRYTRATARARAEQW